MKTFNEFHDGFVEGVLLDGTSAFVFLSTWKKDQFVMKLDDLLSLKMDDFRQGNILFDVLIREGNEVTGDDIESLFGFTEDTKAAEKLAEAHEDRNVVVEVNPSYGASLLAISKSISMVSRETWLIELAATKRLELKAE